MKILAVIPACEGSDTLPNKNIRVIHGKPVIYYVIDHAKKSKYITDIIVTSNSNEVISIAKQMGVGYRLRDISLCSKSVSLDAVVYDVFEQVNKDAYDYVVTMQSVSPALKVKTLDHAFETMLEKGYDTLISVADSADFYWKLQDGRPVPVQPQRMNRHLLAPFYKETGAFFITKTCFVQIDSRIGEKTGLYELQGEEAADIYTFGDLKQVESAMDRKRTAFYVNGNRQIGLGHISRVLQIADELFTKPDIYYDYRQTNVCSFGTTTHRLIPVDGNQGFINALTQRTYDVVVNDILSTDRHYMQAVRRAALQARIVNFEDEGEGALLADEVVNALYERGSHDNVKAGSRYYILPKLFLIYDAIPIADRVSRVIVTFGGADPKEYTERFLALAVMPEFASLHFYVVFGAANQSSERLETYRAYSNITILHNIDNMPEIMSRCDIAVTSRGRTCYELAALGIPTISVAQNQREERHDFICEENGFVYLGFDPPAEQILKEFRKLVLSGRQKRENMQNRMLKNDLRHGRQNVTAILTGTGYQKANHLETGSKEGELTNGKTIFDCGDGR